MSAQYILQLLKCCEALADFEIAIDFLKKTSRSISVKLNDAKQTVRSYCDGSKIYYKEVQLDIRLGAGEERNLQNKELIESFYNELLIFGKGISFPPPPAGIVPLKIEISDGAQLVADEIHNAKYKLSFKIYFMEKRG